MDAYRTREAEEAQALQVVGFHERERVEPEHAHAHHECHERIPPRRVVREHEDGLRTCDVGQLGEPSDMHVERAPQPSLAAPREPAGEERGLVRADHDGAAESTSSCATPSGGADACATSCGAPRRARSASTSRRADEVCARAPMLSQPRARMTRPMSA